MNSLDKIEAALERFRGEFSPSTHNGEHDGLWMDACQSLLLLKQLKESHVVVPKKEYQQLQNIKHAIQGQIDLIAQGEENDR